jgi:hypothetical protein
MNPHISNLDRIYPGERVLIPDSLNESVSLDQIWQNVFSHIPPALEQAHSGHRELFFTTPGFSMDNIADTMFAESLYSNLSLSTRRAMLFYNNPTLRRYPCAGALPGGMFLDISPWKLSRIDIHCWSAEQNFFAGYLQELQPMTQEMYQEVGPQETYLLARMVQAQLQPADAQFQGTTRVSAARSPE